uniref:Uncharacterized protein n=1 Tax=Avena sativa TaxID=4498 RepID=A0ACD5WLD4_AVESA
MKGCDNFENHYYVMHDLMHELSRSVSSQECHNISSSSFSADDIQQSIRHISITMENRYDDTIIEEMAKLKSRIDIGNLRTLMVFRNYEGKTARILEDTFKEIKCVRVLFINIYSLESLPLNFSKLIHLQYLKFGSLCCLGINLASALSKLYNLKFLDLRDCFNRFKLPKGINRLVNLRHFIAHGEHHSRVPEVGKMKHLHELKQFYVRRRSVGFGLEELGRLTNLGGELSIHNLERVATKEEAIEAKLSMKRNLRELALIWSKNQPSIDADILDGGLKPHNNLRGLTIKGHGGAIGPSWLCGEISIKHLEFLTLEGVSWVTLPSFSQLTYLKVLWLKNIAGVRVVGPDFGTDRGKSFMHLKEVVFVDMPDLEKWVVEPNCHLFPMLGRITCVRCPNFHALPFFSECSGPSTQDIAYASLCSLYIKDCPKLSLPPMPHTSTLTSVDMHDTTGYMSYQKTKLILWSYRGALALHNLAKVESMTISGGATIAWTDLQMLTSQLRLEVKECDSMLPSKLVALTGIARESTMQSMALISNPMSLTRLDLVDCKNLNVDGFSPLITVNLKELMVCNRKNSSRSIAEDLLSEVARTKSMLPAGSFQLETLTVDCISVVLVAPICSLVASTLQKLAIRYDQRVESFTEEEEKALQLLTSLQRLQFDDCPCLPSLPQGLHGLSSLRKLKVRDCPEIRSLPKHGLPTSLEKLNVDYCSAELQDQIEELKRTNGNLRVYA